MEAGWLHRDAARPVRMPTSIGTRLRYTLDRDSDLYKSVYNQCTAVERINSQAIANQNTLIYILINLRFLQRLCSSFDADHAPSG